MSALTVTAPVPPEPAQAGKLCRHCNRPTISYRRRGLCWGCYQQPGIRARYFIVGKYRGQSLPARPTEARPGTEAKVLVMIERARKRQQLFHPEDAPL